MNNNIFIAMSWSLYWFKIEKKSSCSCIILFHFLFIVSYSNVINILIIVKLAIGLLDFF